MLNNSYSGCLGLGLSAAISAQFTLICVEAPNNDKFIKTPYFQGSRQFRIIDIDSHTKLLNSACYKKLHVFAYMQPFLRAKAATAFSAS